MRRTLFFAVPLAIAAASCSRPPPAMPAPRPVVVESPKPLSDAAAEVFAGSVKARIENPLSFRVPGKILERKVDMGTRVKAGTVIAVLDPNDAKLNLDNARSAVAAAEADLALAQAEEKRYSDLMAKGYVGQSLVDTRVNTTKLAQARLGQARSQYDLAKNQSKYTELEADSDGVVTEVTGEVGMVVAAGQPIARFAADGEREVAIDVPEGGIEAMKKAPRLGVQIFTNPTRVYTGRVRDINPQADPGTRTHLVHVTIVDADDAVQLGASATVMAGAAGDASLFRLPATALGGPRPDQTAVWRVEKDGHGQAVAQPVPVTVVQYLEDTVVVSGKLDPKDLLITAGVHLLEPGMAVQPIDRSLKAAL